MHEQLLEPHWLRIGLPGVRIGIINSRWFPPPLSTPVTSPQPSPPVWGKSYYIPTGRSIALPSSCNNCVPIVMKTSSRPPPYKWPLWVESQWLYALPDALGDPAAWVLTHECAEGQGGGWGGGWWRWRQVVGGSCVCETGPWHTRPFS